MLNIRGETKEYNYGKHKCHENNPVNYLAPEVPHRQMLAWPLSDCLLVSVREGITTSLGLSARTLLLSLQNQWTPIPVPS